MNGTRLVHPVNLIVTWGVLMNAASAGAAEPKVFKVQNRADFAVRIDGDLSDEGWREATWEKGFFLPWESHDAPATRFSAASDGQRLYFAFDVEDTDIVTVNEQSQDEMIVALEDRVELFFACDAELKRYYCLEIDPHGRVLDYKASFHRQFDAEWDCPSLSVAAKTRTGGYSIELSIDHAVLRELELPDLRDERPLLAGMFRAELSPNEAKKPQARWISWVDPRTSKPDFHVPSAFGQMQLDGK